MLSIIVYNTILKNKSILLPNLESLRDELWLFVILFLYKVFSDTKLSYQAEPQRYINYKFFKLFTKYQKEVEVITDNKKVWAIIYAIMIFESFNRPKVLRIIESIIFLFKKPSTLGIMQVKTRKFLNDLESIRIGAALILKYYKEIESEFKNKKSERIYNYNYQLIENVALKYNSSSNYAKNIADLSEQIMKEHFKDEPVSVPNSKA